MGQTTKYVIGICAMDIKARSKPMRNILNRLIQTGEFEAVIFGDKVILDEDVENWPTCDFLISFFSTGFPLQKAIEYLKLRQPYCVNDLPSQQVLLDRRLVMRVLDAQGILTPRRLMTNVGDVPELGPDVYDRFSLAVPGLDISPKGFPLMTAEQVDHDTIRVGDQTFTKPFVEKPASGEDHNISIYYPKSAGGGCRRLFRKVANKSSEFQREATEIRSGTSFIYEEFMDVDNAEDVKVYTIGPSYAHAETRKSPFVDGIVRRNAEGKEVRYITPLSPEEKEIARKVTEAFGQAVCGFDLLRSNGKSYVIDVNGWSFVKGNEEYYDKCAAILHETFLREAKLRSQHPEMQKTLPRELSFERQWKLKAFLCVLRHGDRTPKQKMKFNFKSAAFLDLLNGSTSEVILKGSMALKSVVAAAQAAASENLDDQQSLDQLSRILNAKSDLAGTKVQVKPNIKKSGGTPLAATPTGGFPSIDRVQLIVKWGGEFTHGGLHQSKDLAENLRKDLKIINRALLDDVKVYSSSERRVLATSEVFASIFMGIVGDLPPGTISVQKEMLDDSNAAKEQMEVVKGKLQQMLSADSQFEGSELGFAAEVRSLAESLKTMRTIMRETFAIKDVKAIQDRWCCWETPELFKERWEKLMKDFVDVDPSAFEPSKVSELYDSLKYDLLHNRTFLDGVFCANDKKRELLRDVYTRSKRLFDLVGPREYGIETQEKLEIGGLSAIVLLKQLVEDLQTAARANSASTRLYFTKESKVICLLNMVLLCGLATKKIEPENEELDYLTQIAFELYERNRAGNGGNDVDSREFALRLSFSPGAHDPNLVDLQTDSRHSLSVAPRRWISDHISLDDALRFLSPSLNKADSG
ncbi:histidine phosphatase superfamily-domain-containing protein [Cladochytrium replicatum]|nr:histidine phosphatase superfamily-domain-containing protein [Cladochytrium replicatum]